MGSIRQWITEQMTPVIMIISSPEADAILADRDGLTVADLLRPLAFLRQLNGASPPPFPAIGLSAPALPLSKCAYARPLALFDHALHHLSGALPPIRLSGR